MNPTKEIVITQYLLSVGQEGESAAPVANPNAFTNSGVPTAVVAFAEDSPIRRYAEHANNIVRWTDIEEGGHFAALEQPDRLITDLRSFATELIHTDAGVPPLPGRFADD